MAGPSITASKRGGAQSLYLLTASKLSPNRPPLDPTAERRGVSPPFRPEVALAAAHRLTAISLPAGRLIGSSSLAILPS
jgi:hypothetical protein